MDKSFDTPILIIIYNRAELTEKLFDRIREIKPSSLYIGADGPKDNITDRNACKQTKLIFDKIDWKCEVHKLYRDKNIGCKEAVKTSIDWFFENVESGIILEDDCYPSISFFNFCKITLEKYQNDSRVMMISGYNALNNYNSKYSYLFSKIGSIWGWATWKRSWNLYIDDKNTYLNAKDESIIEQVLHNKEQIEHRITVCDLVYLKGLNTWDYQWTFTRLINSGLSIVPTKNLVINLGNNIKSTHKHNEEAKYADKTFELNEIKHPDFIYPSTKFDNIVYESFYLLKPSSNNENENYYNNLIKKIIRCLKS